MSKKLLTTFIILLFTSSLFSQDFSIAKKKIKPTVIDTSTNKTFIYELQKVRLYFRQQDIVEYLKDPKNKNILGSIASGRLLDTLQSGMKIITVRNIPDHTNDAEFDSLLRIYGDSIALQELNSQFYFIGAALMLNEKFMLYSKLENKFIKKGVFARTRRGLLGQRTLHFYIPNKQQFYYIITRLGE